VPFVEDEHTVFLHIRRGARERPTVDELKDE
jgi:hypothetical protein